jgi:hypothetical protein
MRRALFNVPCDDGLLFASVPLDGSSTELGEARVRLKKDDPLWTDERVKFVVYERRSGEEDILPSQHRVMPIHFWFESTTQIKAAQERPVS